MKDFTIETILSTDKTTERPPYTYSALIVMAIRSSPEGRLTVNGIYEWIKQNFSYYRESKINWKNSIRHNLTQKSIFRSKKRPGRGDYWTIDRAYQDVTIGKDTGRVRCSNTTVQSFQATNIHYIPVMSQHPPPISYQSQSQNPSQPPFPHPLMGYHF